MRIIGGESRGRLLRFPKGSLIRPTADRVKESLFAILEPVAGKRFLDVFAGSGNVGLEALSRGASFAAFVEKDRRLVKAIQENLEILGFQRRAETVAMPAASGIKHLAARGTRFDILFADPPYDEGFVAQTRTWWTGADLLAENGIVVLQHSVREIFEESQWPAWTVSDRRRYGDTLLTFLSQGKREREK